MRMGRGEREGESRRNKIRIGRTKERDGGMGKRMLRRRQEVQEDGRKKGRTRGKDRVCDRRRGKGRREPGA